MARYLITYRTWIVVALLEWTPERFVGIVDDIILLGSQIVKVEPVSLVACRVACEECHRVCCSILY